MKLDKYFQENELSFCPYLLVGYPDKEKFFQLVDILVAKGAKIFEFGIPFSDPVADGPVLTQANDVVVKNGIGILEALDMIVEVKSKYPDVGIVIMSYYNPIFRYGFDKFVEFMKTNSIDGFLIPDIPSSEYDGLKGYDDVDNVMIISNNISDEKIIEISNKTSGFLYILSSIATTGGDLDYYKELSEFVARVRTLIGSEKKLVVGFGIKDKKDVDFLEGLEVDGFIIGSHIVSLYSKGGIEEVKNINLY